MSENPYFIICTSSKLGEDFLDIQYGLNYDTVSPRNPAHICKVSRCIKWTRLLGCTEPIY